MSRSHTAWRSPAALFAAAAFLLAGFSVVQASSRPAVVAAPTAVGIVDLERLIGTLNEVNAQNTELQKRAKDLQARIDDIKKQAEAAEQEWKIAPANDPKKLEKRFKLEELTLQLEANRQGLSKVLGVEKGRYVRSLYGRIVEAAQQLAQQQGLNLIVLDDRSLTLPEGDNLTDAQLNQIIQSKSVLYADNSVDVTDALARVMNNNFSAPKPKGKN
jgi:Skp family chaperone for outer membrane proteins